MFPNTIHQAPGITLTRDPSRLLLAFKAAPMHEAVANSTRELGLDLEQLESTEQKRVPGGINHTTERFWVRAKTGEAAAEPITARLAQAGAQQLDFAAPVYHVEGRQGPESYVCPLPNVLLIKPHAKAAQIEEGLKQLATRYGLEEVPARSQYLAPFRYFIVKNPAQADAYEIQGQLLEQSPDLIDEVLFENMPMVVPVSVVPNDTLYAQQWDMVRIQAGGPGTTGWNLSTGLSTVVVCVLDSGCDLTHPDLTYASTGINLGTMSGTGAPTGSHGTACAGIIAARYNNLLGVAGVAGGCKILPAAFQNWTDTEVAAGINYAVSMNAKVISMSFGWDLWNHAVIDPAIQNAFNAGLVMCVATHNYNGPITYPATNPLVMAIGASDEADNRKSPTSPDGELWGSDFGPEISVVAPGVHIPTTDRQGNAGYNPTNSPAGDYTLTFNGTSAATPHVAGLAALLFSEYSFLNNVQVRNIIERTAAKVGAVPYADTPAHPNGTWNQEMGYGRINVWSALDFADVMIRDYPADSGKEPSSPPSGDYWDFSDIVIRRADDGVFLPGNPLQSSRVEKGQTNYLYIRVRNLGPAAAHNVVVDVRITPYVGLHFVYPGDWTAVDAMHAVPAAVTNTFATIPKGGSVIAKFKISTAQTNTFWGWEHSHPWHPCLLAQVRSNNDYAFHAAPTTGTDIVPRRNNFAQRNLTVVNVIKGAKVSFPVMVGNLLTREKQPVEVVVETKEMQLVGRMNLMLDDINLLPQIPRMSPDLRLLRPTTAEEETGMVFLERTLVETSIGSARGLLTLEKGSKLELKEAARPTLIEKRGGEILLKERKRVLEIREQSALVRFDLEPGRLYPMVLQTMIPDNAATGTQFTVRVFERDLRGQVLGGATVIYVVQ